MQNFSVSLTNLFNLKENAVRRLLMLLLIFVFSLSFVQAQNNAKDNSGGKKVLITGVSGNVYDAQGRGLDGVVVRVQTSATDNSSSPTTTTGAYSVSVSPAGFLNINYTLAALATPSRTGWTFNPSTASWPLATGGNQTQNFTGIRKVQITGTIVGGGTHAPAFINGALIQIQQRLINGTPGPLGTINVTTNASGQYSATVDAAYEYEVISITKPGYNFTNLPNMFNGTIHNRLYNDTTFGNSTGTPINVTFGGTITLGLAGPALSGVNVTITGYYSNDPTHTTLVTFGPYTTNGSGVYTSGSLTEVGDGDWTLTPALAGYTFNPSAALHNDVSTATITQNFVASKAIIKISGYVRDYYPTPDLDLQGIIVDLTGDATQQYTTNSSGYYEFLVPARSNYTVAPVATNTGYLFVDTPTVANTTYTYAAATLTADQANQNFSGRLQHYNITGSVLKDGNGFQGVDVRLTGTDIYGTPYNITVASAATTGDYQFLSLPARGNYVVTALVTQGAGVGHTFAPPNRTFNNLLSTYSGQNFVTDVEQYTLSGTITGPLGTVNNVPITLTQLTKPVGQPDFNSVGSTSGSGNYSFVVPAGYTFRITPQVTPDQGYTYAPVSHATKVVTSDSVYNFTAVLNTYKIWGIIRLEGTPINGVVVNLAGGSSGTYTTQNNVTYGDGYYEFFVTALGNYTITPTSTLYSFDPSSATFSNIIGDKQQDFTATRKIYTITGTVTADKIGPGLGGGGLAGVRIDVVNAPLVGGNSPGVLVTPVVTDEYGNYTVSVYADYNYTLTPSKQYYDFNPVSITTTSGMNANLPNQNFTATLQTFTARGHIYFPYPTGLEGIRVNLEGPGIFSGQYTTTDMFGNFSFILDAGGDYTFTPYSTCYTFSPTFYLRNNYYIVEGYDYLDFYAAATTAPTLLTPVNNSGSPLHTSNPPVTTLTPTFTWTAPCTVIDYELQVYSSSDFVIANKKVALTGITTTTWGTTGQWAANNPNQLEYAHTYYWRVRARNSAGWTNWSQTFNFTTGIATPILESPVSSTTNPTAPTDPPVSTSPALIWKTVEGALRYTVEIYTNSTFTGIPFRQTPTAITTTSWQVSPELVAGQQYWWRVKAYNDEGQSGWTDANGSTSNPAKPYATFKTEAGIPLLYYPPLGEMRIPTKPNTAFVWYTTPGAASYTLIYSTDVTFPADPAKTKTKTLAGVNDPTYPGKLTERVTGLTIKTTYFWKVIAIGNAGDTKESDVWSFRTVGSWISVVPTPWAYPTTVTGRKTPKEFTVTNNGDETLQIPRINISGTNPTEFTGTQVNTNQTITLGPGASTIITINFSPLSPGNKAANLEFYHNDPAENQNPLIVPLTGVAVRTMANLTVTSPLDFGQRYVLTAPVEQSIALKNTSTVEGDLLSITAATFENSDGIFEVVDKPPFSILPQQTFNLRVRFTPLRTGLLTNKLHILNSSLNLPDAVVDVKGTVIEANLVIRPLSIDFKNTSIGAPRKDSLFEVINYGTVPITISSKILTGDLDAFSLTQNTNNVTLSTNQTDTIKVRFSPTTISGRRNSVITLTSNDPLPGAQVRYLNMTGVAGDNPLIYVYPSEIDFDGLARSATKDTIILVRNDGSLTLNVSNLTFTGDNADMYSFISGGTAFSLASGQSANVRIRVVGKVPVGAKTAKLQITSNDPANSVVNVNLFTTVRTPLLWKSVEKVVWDTVLVKYCVDTVITIGNSGNMSVNINQLKIVDLNAADYSATPTGNVTFPYELKPNTTMDIKITYCPKQAGNRYARLVIYNDDPANMEASIVLRGNTLLIYGEMEADTVIDFGKVFVMDFSTRELKLNNNSKLARMVIDSLKIISIDNQPFSHQSKATPYTIERLSSYTFTLKFAPTSTAQKYLTTYLYIYYDNPTKSPFRVRLVGTVSFPRTMMSLPPVLKFGKVPIDSSKTISFDVINVGDANLKIDILKPSGVDSAEFKVTGTFPMVIEPEGKRTMSVTFSPKKLGVKESQIKFVWNDVFNAGVIEVMAEGTPKGSGALAIRDNEIPKDYSLSQNYPNPFNPSTRIEYSIPKEELVTIKVYNNLGQELETLLNTVQPAGNYRVDWNPHYLSSGVYFYKIQAGKFTSLKKMMYVR